jgi:hypothetical protein
MRSDQTHAPLGIAVAATSTIAIIAACTSLAPLPVMLIFMVGLLDEC